MRDNGQITTYDFMMGFLIFMLLFAALKFSWMDSFVSGLEQQKLSQMEFEASRAADSMLRFYGKPEKWNPENVEIIGLVKRGKLNVLDESKVLNFAALPYSQSKELLQIDFNFLFELDSVNDSFDLNAGNSVIPSNSRVVNVERVVFYKGVEAIVRFSVFE